MRSTRFAGARLGAQDITDVTEELKSALEALAKSQKQIAGFERSVPVPGTQESIYLSARPIPIDVPDAPDGTKVFGNREQIQQLQKLDSPGMVELVWGANGRSDDPGTKLRVGRTANRAWKEALKELPDNTIVRNYPVGATSGDFERSDLYSRAGFGPVQTDGSQYGVIKGGKIEPMSPFVPQEENLRHLADRAYEAGDLDTNDVIRRALNQRRAEGLDQKVSEAEMSKRPAYDDRYGDYDYDDYDYDPDYDSPEPMPQTREQLKERVDNYLSGGYSGNGELGQGRPPEIELRSQVEPGYNSLPYQPTGDDIAQFRAQQVAALGIPSGARNQIDVINNYNPRPTPQRITVQDLEAERNGSSLYRFGRRLSDDVTSETMEGRRQQMINAIRANQSGVSAIGGDHDPSVVRDALKRVAVVERTNPDPGAFGVVRQEYYRPEDVEAFRNWQATQAQNWPVDTPFRTPPPTLNPDGSVASRRPTPEGAFESSAHLSSLSGRDPIIPGTTVLNRRMLTPEQEQAVADIARLQRTPAAVDQSLGQLERWFDGSRGGQMFEQLTEAASEAELVGQARPRQMTPELLSRDLQLLEQGITQPGSVPRSVLGQAVADLRGLQASGYGGIGTEIDRLQSLVNEANYGPAAQHREFRIEEPQPVEQYGRPLTLEEINNPSSPVNGETRRRRAARRRPNSVPGFDEIPAGPYKRPSVQVDPSDVFARVDGGRAVKPEGFKFRGPQPDELDRLERMLEGF